MNKRFTTDMADANGLQRALTETYRIFQHQENDRRFLQRAMHNGQYWVLNAECVLLNSESPSKLKTHYYLWIFDP